MVDRRNRPEKPRRVYLGPAFAGPESVLRSRQNAQRYLLDAITEHDPRFFNELAGSMVELCRAALAIHGGMLLEEDVFEIVDDEDYALCPEYAALRDALRDWSKRWRVAESWVRDFALIVLAARAEGLPLGTWLDPMRTESRTAGPGEKFEFEGWDPGREWWGTWKARLDRSLKRFLAGYQERNEKRARDLGMVPNEKRLAAHFEWLVRFQVGKEDFGPIGRSAGKNRNAVSKAVHDLADLIELTLRQPRLGRPTKKASDPEI